MTVFDRTTFAAASHLPSVCTAASSLARAAGTLFDSDPVHFEVFVDLFLKEGVNGGKPIDNEFFRKHIAGRQNALICKDFFPEWDTARAEAWSANKEAVFRERAFGKLVAMPGLEELMQWIDANGIAKVPPRLADAPRAARRASHANAR